MRWIQTAVTFAIITGSVMAQVNELSYKTSPASNIGSERKVMRRDPSDIIKAKDMYYVWYSKGAQSSGYNATIWYATSPDGHTWTEKGEALRRGPEGSWDEQSVYTPNILVAEGKYWLFYTAIKKPFDGQTKNGLGIAVSESPDGPWKKLDTNPILRAEDDPKQFDSVRVDDACLIVRDRKYWLYYKGRQLDKTARQTNMGVAVSDKPEGPYIKNKNNPIVGGGHEVLVWPYGKGVIALIGTVGPKGIAKTLQYADDGVRFAKMADLENVPTAPGAYRPEAFTDSSRGKMIEWGIHIKFQKGGLPFLERFDYTWKIQQTAKPGTEGDGSKPTP